MNDPNYVKIAVIGAGAMGAAHARDISGMENTHLAGVCDIDPVRAAQIAALYDVKPYTNYLDLLEQEKPQAVVIATPHYAHTPLSIACLERGVHVLVEKPLAVHVNDAQKMIAAYEKARQLFPGLVFAIMFQQRTYSYWRKVKDLLDQGQLGRLVRATWIITDWFRAQIYYDHGGWRATWKGEGGGVLLNQCPHNLDLYQWFFGLPRRVTGFAAIGKYHQVEVEDEVTAFFEHENGMVGHFITTTAESPGTNRLEIVGEKGRLVFENGRLSLARNQGSMLEFIRTSDAAFDKVAFQMEDIRYEPQLTVGHADVIRSFTAAVLTGTPPVIQAVEGLNSLSLGNAIMLSHFQQQPLTLPIDGDAYETRLQELVRTSRFQKEVRLAGPNDPGASFGVYPGPSQK